jgi:flagellin-like hook-associated protein FlgL
VNLLLSDSLKVIFNEDGSSMLNIEGVDFTSAGLGLLPLTGDDFQNNITTDAVLARIDGALRTLRTQAATFGTKLGTVETRQNFTKSLIQTLETGADNLVLADTNEEGANMLALQTRQSLSTTALSLSAQADQAVLRLFG